jgi:hypothetical protein
MEIYGTGFILHVKYHVNIDVNKFTVFTRGVKAKTILVKPVIETVLGLIQPHVELFCNMFDDNADILSQIITGKSICL